MRKIKLLCSGLCPLPNLSLNILLFALSVPQTPLHMRKSSSKVTEFIILSFTPEPLYILFLLSGNSYLFVLLPTSASYLLSSGPLESLQDPIRTLIICPWLSKHCPHTSQKFPASHHVKAWTRGLCSTRQSG